MSYRERRDAIEALRARMAVLRDEIRTLQREIEPEPVTDYTLETAAGPRALSELFGERDDLLVIHNMGRACPYCTLWADGLNGVYDHLADRAAFVVTSPDTPEVQRDFAASRGWRFPMASHRGTSFATDMGFGNEADGWEPGVSALQRRDGRIVRVSHTHFGPGDQFAAIWHLFDLFPEGPAGWSPKYAYA